MISAQVADRLINLCLKGEFIQAQEELYHADIISIDPDGSQTTGAQNMHAKEQRFLSNLEAIHHIGYSEALIAGSFFTVILRMEIEIKNIGYKKFEEVCVYQVQDGKIVFEQFFRDVLRMVE
jgi:hypothetical protein